MLNIHKHLKKITLLLLLALLPQPSPANTNPSQKKNKKEKVSNKTKLLCIAGCTTILVIGSYYLYIQKQDGKTKQHAKNSFNTSNNDELLTQYEESQESEKSASEENNSLLNEYQESQKNINALQYVEKELENKQVSASEENNDELLTQYEESQESKNNNNLLNEYQESQKNINALQYVEKELENKQISDLKKLGKGGFGLVYELGPYALKTLFNKEAVQNRFEYIRKRGDSIFIHYQNFAINNLKNHNIKEVKREMQKFQNLGHNMADVCEKYLIKALKKDKKPDLQKELRQIRNLGEGMVKAYGIIEKNGEAFLVLEKIHQKSQEEWNSTSDKRLLTYALEALRIIQDWRREGKEHKDIKHDNMGWRKENNPEDNRLVFIDPLPKIGIARGGYGGGADEVNAMRSLLNLRFSLRRINLFNRAIEHFIKDILRSLCNTVQMEDIKDYLMYEVSATLKDEEYRSMLEKKLYEKFVNFSRSDLSNYLNKAYPTNMKYNLEKNGVPQIGIVYAYLGLDMEIKHFEEIKDLDQQEIKKIWNNGIKKKAEKIGYYCLDIYEEKSNTSIGLITLKLFIAHIQTYRRLEETYNKETRFSTKKVLKKMAYDNLIKENPLLKPMVDMIKEDITIEEAIEQIDETVQNLENTV